MAKVAEGIGNTYDEAVKDALSKVGLSKENVSIEMIEEPKYCPQTPPYKEPVSMYV